MSFYGKVQIGAAAASLLLVSLFVLRVSSAAFSATTENTGNSWSTGSVALTDDDGGGVGQAMFNVSSMVPGQTVTKCIVVTYAGDVDPTGVKLYVSSLTDGGLAPHLDVTVEEGDGGTYADCTGFSPTNTIVNKTLTAFNTDHSGFGNGAGVWDPAATGEDKTYRFSVTLGSDTPSGSQGDDAQASFQWELQTP